MISLIKSKPRSLRIWHWLTALAMVGSILTVLLRKSFLSWRANAELLGAQFQAAGVTVAPDLLKSAAQAMRDRMFVWHFYIGFVLVALLLFRLWIRIRQPDTCVGRDVKAAWAERASSGAKKVLLIKLGYLVFYASLAVMGVTGLSMYFAQSLGIGSGVEHQIQEVHEFFQWVFLAYVPLHVAGVFFEDATAAPGLVSNMIHGLGDRRSERRKP